MDLSKGKSCFFKSININKKINHASSIYLESLLNLNWSDLSWFQHFNTVLSEETALAYFCQVGNPFYDRSSLNEQIITRNLPAEAMV